jgi:hypothetical protein
MTQYGSLKGAKVKVDSVSISPSFNTLIKYPNIMNVEKIRLLKLLLFNILLLLGSHYSIAQQGSVSGTVVDTNNEPLIGVTVSIVNTNQGVVTDFNGSYTIAADPKSVLQFFVCWFRI